MAKTTVKTRDPALTEAFRRTLNDCVVELMERLTTDLSAHAQGLHDGMEREQRRQLEDLEAEFERAKKDAPDEPTEAPEDAMLRDAVEDWLEERRCRARNYAARELLSGEIQGRVSRYAHDYLKARQQR